MKKTIILVLTIFLSFNSYSQKKRKIPFFGKVLLTELCGSDQCAPTYGIRAYIHKKDKLYYNGEYSSVLGRIFKKDIFSSLSSSITNLTKDDVDYFVEVDGTGSVEEKSKKEFDANLTATLTDLLRKDIDLKKNLKAKLLAEVDKIVENKTRNNIEYSFKIIQLKRTGDIDNKVATAVSNLNKDEKLIVGISVVTVSGNWTSKSLKEVINKFEATAGWSDSLSAEAKLNYEKSKKRVLEGKVKEFGFIIADSYLMN
ncbi:hypothetical protein [Thalassobellus citreus]|uniref:hypothetical protein n=1 Tax=Thalassobellus citreus TaxID=3367752 RepID=UPI0037A7153D